ncbi:hypothetical protein [Aeromonas dhakensis]|uniref:hypothetical protein n=1 Tax=Aeromonas dhakensis TaxID=196024 RepID=UPI001B37AABB|nr:hypothetical protein [Aeromonas dhakensis]
MLPVWFEMVMKHSCLMAYELNKSALFVEPCDGMRADRWPGAALASTRQQGSKAARQQGSKAARQQGSKAARQQGSKAARQRSERKKLRQRK